MTDGGRNDGRRAKEFPRWFPYGVCVACSALTSVVIYLAGFGLSKPPRHMTFPEFLIALAEGVVVGLVFGWWTERIATDRVNCILWGGFLVGFCSYPLHMIAAFILAGVNALLR